MKTDVPEIKKQANKQTKNHSGRLDIAEYLLMATNKMKHAERKTEKKNKQSKTEFWDKFKLPNTYVIGVAEKGEGNF